MQKAGSRSTYCSRAITPPAARPKACLRKSRRSCMSMSGGTALLEFHLTVAGTHENVTVSGAPVLVEAQASTPFPRYSMNVR